MGNDSVGLLTIALQPKSNDNVIALFYSYVLNLFTLSHVFHNLFLPNLKLIFINTHNFKKTKNMYALIVYTYDFNLFIF